MVKSTPQRSFVAGLAGLTVAFSGLAVVSTAAPAQGASSGLIINEVYGGGGGGSATAFSRADFVELYNATGVPLSLAGLSLQYRAAGYTSGSVSKLDLPDETVPAHGHYLVQVSSNTGPAPELPVTPDHVGTSLSMAQGAGQIMLVQGSSLVTMTGTSMHTAATVIDFVGYGAATSSETAPTEATVNTTSVQRNDATDEDNNAADFAPDAAPTPTNSGPEEPGVLTAVDPGDQTATVGTPITPVTLQATGGTGSYAWDFADTLPPGITEQSDGVIGGTPLVAGTYLSEATVTDGTSSDTVFFRFTVTADSDYTIAEIQGTGSASPMVGQTVTTEGVVTALYPTAQSGYRGMYIQTVGSGGSTNDTPGASDAIFVFFGNGDPVGVEIGDSVEVTGVVGEFNGMTQITPPGGGVAEIGFLGTVAPRTTVPGTDCGLPGSTCLTGPALDSAREAFEGELFQPTGDYTVTDVHDGSAFNGSSFSSSFFGEVGLAAESDIPLVTPTEVIDAQATALIAERKAYNDAHRMVLDDGASLTYWNTFNSGAMDQPLPWFTETNQVRVGAAVTFPKPVVMEFRNNTWKLQPQMRVTDDGADRVRFEQDRPALPHDVGGDLKLGTFNVLNYFTTLGEDVAGCSSFKDRLGEPVAVNQCPGAGPRGAWDDADFGRQQTKIVNAINTMDADIIALEEIENSGIVDGGDRDEAVAALVEALNADAGSRRWAFVDSPASVDPGEDVIRTALIYNPATVALVGASDLFYDPAFDNAREPFAQTFRAVGSRAEDGFAVIANHFKSKGSGDPDPFGQGNATNDRVAQAHALAGFAEAFAADNGVERIFLTGDFNAYSEEDPMQVLRDAGFTSLESTSDPDEESYSFDGMIGSLDHVLANGAALPEVTGVDIWTINAYESQYYEYSRHNYNIRQLYSPEPFRASDHNPEIVGIDVVEDERLAATVTAGHTPHKVRVDHTRAKLRVEVSAAGVQPTGTVTVTVPGQGTSELVLVRGRAVLTLDEFDAAGETAVTIAYSGDDAVKPQVIEHVIEVVD